MENVLFVLCIYQQLQMLKAIILWLKILYLSDKTIQIKFESLSVPILDIHEKFEKTVIKKCTFQLFFATLLFLFLIKTLRKTLRLTDLKVVKNSSLKGPGLSCRQKQRELESRLNQSNQRIRQNISGKFQISCEVMHHEKSSISSFQ